MNNRRDFLKAGAAVAAGGGAGLLAAPVSRGPLCGGGVMAMAPANEVARPPATPVQKAPMPAASAAAAGPMKIASGKFHGPIVANTPRPASFR